MVAPGRGRGLDHPPRAEVARDRHPPGAGDPAALDRHHHRHDQGQHPGPDRLRRLLADRLAGDPRPGRGGGAARPGRHALPRRRHLEAAADPGRLRHRGGDRPDHRATGPSRANPNSRRSCSRRARWSRRASKRRRVRPRQRRPARRGDPPRRRDRNRLGLDDPAPPAGRLHPRRAPDRHARAPRRDLRLRGLQAAPGADHRRPTCRACSAAAASPSRSRSTPTSRRPRSVRARRGRSDNDGDGHRHRRDPARGAKSPQSRPLRGRGGDQDPRRATCGRSRTRSGTRCPAAPTRAASSAPTPPTSASTASGSPTSTGASAEAPPAASAPPSGAEPVADRRPRRRRSVCSAALVARRSGRSGRGRGRRSAWRRRRRRRLAGSSAQATPATGAGARGSARARSRRPKPRRRAAAWRRRPKSGSACSTRSGKPLVDGQILAAGAEEGPFRSGSFTVSFGNGEVDDAHRRQGQPRSGELQPGRLLRSSRGGELTRARPKRERPTCA